MLITKQELIKLDACKKGLDRFVKQTNNTDKPVEVVSLIGGLNIISDLVWLAGEKLPQEKVVRFACDCALLNIELIKPYTDKYDLIVDFLKNPSTSIHAANYAVTAAARSAHAARVARSATTAARVATTAAAQAAEWAATTIEWAARSAAHAVCNTGRNCIVSACAPVNAARVSPEKVNDLLRDLFK